jgi:hypothetical protein
LLGALSLLTSLRLGLRLKPIWRLRGASLLVGIVVADVCSTSLDFTGRLICPACLVTHGSRRVSSLIVELRLDLTDSAVLSTA